MNFTNTQLKNLQIPSKFYFQW